MANSKSWKTFEDARIRRTRAPSGRAGEVGVVNVTKRKGAREKSVSKLNVRGHLGLLIWLISQFSRASSDFFL